MTGRLFDVKEFSVHDGPGARITFFLKGCPLQCLWCHNPEGQSPHKELMIRSALCEHCGNCLHPTDTPLFQKYGRNPAACPKGLITESGFDYTPEQLLSRVLPLREMLKHANGGVTFSGGEPLAQADFLLECIPLLHGNGIHVAVETSGYASFSVFQAVANAADYIIMDIKVWDAAEHARLTGKSNQPIIQNAAYLKTCGTPHLFRTPRIPGCTDSEDNLASIAQFVQDSPWEILPYNELAGAKYPMLGRLYPLSERKEQYL